MRLPSDITVVFFSFVFTGSTNFTSISLCQSDWIKNPGHINNNDNNKRKKKKRKHPKNRCPLIFLSTHILIGALKTKMADGSDNLNGTTHSRWTDITGGSMKCNERVSRSGRCSMCASESTQTTSLWRTFTNLHSGSVLEAPPRHHAFGIGGKHDPKPLKWPLVSANESCSFKCKWLPTMEATIFETAIQSG